MQLKNILWDIYTGTRYVHDYQFIYSRLFMEKFKYENWFLLRMWRQHLGNKSRARSGGGNGGSHHRTSVSSHLQWQQLDTAPKLQLIVRAEKCQWSQAADWWWPAMVTSSPGLMCPAFRRLRPCPLQPTLHPKFPVTVSVFCDAQSEDTWHNFPEWSFTANYRIECRVGSSRHVTHLSLHDLYTFKCSQLYYLLKIFFPHVSNPQPDETRVNIFHGYSYYK